MSKSIPPGHVDSGDPIEALKQAFHRDDPSLFQNVLARHPELKSKINQPVDGCGSPPITLVRGRAMLDALLAAGADINARSQWWAGGFGLLDSARPELAAYAIERGATVDVHAAARLGMIEKLRELIALNPKLVQARGGDGQTPLHFASNVEVARLLLDHGADIDARDVDHESTPAQYMVRDRQEIARFLVQRGCKTDILMAAALGDTALVSKHLDADPNCIHVRVTDEYFPKTNHKGGGTIYQWTLGWYVSPHEVAKASRHEDTFQLLMSRSPDDVRLIVACWLNDQAEAKSLVKQNPQLVAALPDTYRRHSARAARNNNVAAVRLMLETGLPVDALGQHRATPLHWAGFHGNVEMTRDILQHNPPLELRDADFNATPLGWAIHGSLHGWHRQTGDYGATAEALLQAGAKLP
ncbi:MAG TPA: ankyrin repeat domain-containing protein, partial [Candidatus Acidoferrum sp.]|nr:ankyrin repeat domain-containing protein [Candidatus Acidoferrum sp.]